MAEAQRTKRLRLLLDYDGTLVPITRSPELAVPDEEVLALLANLSDTHSIEARPREWAPSRDPGGLVRASAPVALGRTRVLGSSSIEPRSPQASDDQAFVDAISAWDAE